MLTFDLIVSNLNISDIQGKQNTKIPRFLMDWEIPSSLRGEKNISGISKGKTGWEEAEGWITPLFPPV